MPWFTFHFDDFTISFLSLLLEAAPYLLAGSLISGFVEVFLPASALDRWLPKNKGAAVLVSGIAPLFLPMCECGVVPVIRRFLRKGLSPACAVTYMLAAPIVNPVVLLSTFAAFSGGKFFDYGGGGGMTFEPPPWAVVFARFGIGYLIAVGCGFLALAVSPDTYIKRGVLAPPRPPGRTGVTVLPPDDSGVSLSPWRRVLDAFGYAGRDFAEVGAYLVMGCIITSLFNTGVNQDLILPLALEPWTATAVMLGFAFVLAICSTSDAFIAATFVTFPLASRIGFMVYGPLFDVRLMFLYALVFKKRIVAAFGVGLFVVVAVTCDRLMPFLP